MAEKAYRPNQWVEAGFLSRGALRLELTRKGIEFTETKSMLSSLFQLKVTPEHWEQIRRTIEED